MYLVTYKNRTDGRADRMRHAEFETLDMVEEWLYANRDVSRHSVKISKIVGKRTAERVLNNVEKMIQRDICEAAKQDLNRAKLYYKDQLDLLEEM